MSGTRPAGILTVSSAILLRSSNVRWGNSPVLPSTEIPSTPAATKRSTTASVARKSISPRSSKGVTIAGIDPVNIRLVSPFSSKARLLRASRLIYLHPTPSPDGRQNDKEKSTTPLRAEVASRGRQRLFLSGVALGSRRRGAVWFRLIHSTNLPRSGWAFRASSVLYSRSSSLLSRTTCTCLWQGEHRPSVRWTSCRSNVFLFRLFLWRVLGTRWCRVSFCTVRPHNPHAPPLFLLTP